MAKDLGHRGQSGDGGTRVGSRNYTSEHLVSQELHSVVHLDVGNSQLWRL